MLWGRAVVCAMAGCLAFGLSAGGVAEARIPILGWGAFSQKDATAERYAEAEALVAAVKDSPALGFYYVVDEPNIAMAESICDCVARYDALDPAHPCYVNLYGVPRDEKYARIFTGCATYREYLDRLYGTVPLKMVSFDVYPVLSVLEPSGWQGGESFSELPGWKRVDAISQMKTP